MDDAQYDQDHIMRYAMEGAVRYDERMENVEQRSKDAFYDGIMAKSMKLHTKSYLVKAYGLAFVCRDPNCTVCDSYRDGEAVSCRTCHAKLRPRAPSQQEVIQFHRSYACLELPSFDAHNKPPSKFISEDSYEKTKSTLSKYRSSTDFIVGFNDPKTLYDEDWGIKRCGCLIHLYNWEICSYCSPAPYKTSPYSVQWRHYVDFQNSDKPIVFNKDYYTRIYEILCEESRPEYHAYIDRVDYAEADHPIFQEECSYCGSIPLDDKPESKFPRCARCKKTRYCSPDCQKWHWREHKKNCREPTQEEVDQLKRKEAAEQHAKFQQEID